MIILLYNIRYVTLKSVNYSNHGKDDNSIEKFKRNKRSDEIAHENMTNIEENNILDFKTLQFQRRPLGRCLK